MPDQSLDVKEDLKDAALIADDGIKLEVEEAMEAQRQYSVLEQICFALDPNTKNIYHFELFYLVKTLAYSFFLFTKQYKKIYR